MACVVLYSPAVDVMQNLAVMRSINLRPCCVTEETMSHIASFVTLCLTRPRILIFTLGNYTTLVVNKCTITQRETATMASHLVKRIISNLATSCLHLIFGRLSTSTS